MAISDNSKPKMALDEQQIKRYLQENPDFLLRHDQLLTELELPQQWANDDNVVDFRGALIHNLQQQLQMRDVENSELFSIARVNHDYQQRIYDLALQMLACHSLQGLLAMLEHDMPNQLELEKIVLCIVPHPEYEDFIQDICFDNLRCVDKSLLKTLQGKQVLQRKDIKAEPEIYGMSEIHSDMLVAVNFYKCHGFIAYGSYQAEQFDSKMASDYMIFLTDAFVAMIKLLNDMGGGSMGSLNR